MECTPWFVALKRQGPMNPSASCSAGLVIVNHSQWCLSCFALTLSAAPRAAVHVWASRSVAWAFLIAASSAVRHHISRCRCMQSCTNRSSWFRSWPSCAMNAAMTWALEYNSDVAPYACFRMSSGPPRSARMLYPWVITSCSPPPYIIGMLSTYARLLGGTSSILMYWAVNVFGLSLCMWRIRRRTTGLKSLQRAPVLESTCMVVVAGFRSLEIISSSSSLGKCSFPSLLMRTLMGSSLPASA